MSITNSPIRISRSFKTGGTLLTDNNSWNRDGDHAARVFSANGGMWYAEGGNDDIHVTHITGGDEALHVNCAVLNPKLVEGAQRDLGIDFSKRVANKEDYRLIRIATPTLWDSLAVTILRHAVQAGKAQHSIKKSPTMAAPTTSCPPPSACWTRPTPNSTAWACSSSNPP